MNPHDPDLLGSLATWVTGQRQQMLDDLRSYVECETPSDDLEALRAGRDWVHDYLRRQLGNPGDEEHHGGGEYGDTLVLTYPGTGASASAGTVTLLAHYDTVWPLGTLAEIPFTVSDDVIRGPGVFDMKAGLIQAVYAVRALDHQGLPRPPLRWVLNGDEELGSPASRPVIEQASRDAAAVLVFEASADAAIKTARKGVGLFDVVLHGVEAHAGLDPLSGASAITAAAELVTHLAGGQDLQAGTSINVGIIQGGTRRNVAAGQCRLGIDVRVRSAGEQRRVELLLSGFSPTDPRVRVEVTGGWNRPVMERTPATAALYERARTVAAGIGVDLKEIAVGGASDGNFAAALGVPVLDGLGAVGAGAHARTEYATVSGLLERTTITAGLLASLTDA